MSKKPRVPPMGAAHEWVLLGEYKIELGHHEAKRILENPEDIAISFQERAQLETVQGPGCAKCGIHAKDGIGKPCLGERRLENVRENVELAHVRSKIWTPGSS